MTLTTHKDRCTERVSSYTRNDGNRIATVRDDADAVTQAGSMDYPGGASAMAFEYDSSGSLIKAILFTATGENGKVFDKESRQNMGSSTAVVLKQDGSTEKFDACTNPSDSEKYATVPAGNYEAKVGMHKGEYAALRVGDVGTDNFNANIIELGQPNPSDKNTTKAKYINIHKPGKGNVTGNSRDKKAISKGCLLIDIYKWNSFIEIFDNSDQKNNTIGIIIQR